MANTTENTISGHVVELRAAPASHTDYHQSTGLEIGRSRCNMMGRQAMQIVYAGTRDELVLAGLVADEQFPVGRKRKTSFPSAVDDRSPFNRDARLFPDKIERVAGGRFEYRRHLPLFLSAVA